MKTTYYPAHIDIYQSEIDDILEMVREWGNGRMISVVEANLKRKRNHRCWKFSKLNLLRFDFVIASYF